MNVDSRCDDVANVVTDKDGAGSKGLLGAARDIVRAQRKEEHVTAGVRVVRKDPSSTKESSYGAPKHGRR